MSSQQKQTSRLLLCGTGRLRLGLTLVEMLVVMGICGVLALLLVPIVFRSRERARQTVCKGNLNNLGQTFAVCLMENNNYLPTVYYSIQKSDDLSLITLRSATEDVPDVLFENGHNDGLTCPSDDRPAEVLARGQWHGRASWRQLRLQYLVADRFPGRHTRTSTDEYGDIL